jgi:hypothetical protein
VTESIEDFYKNPGSFEAPPAGTSTDSGIQMAGAAKPSPSPTSHALPSTTASPRPRRTRPEPDDWAYFDSSQSAFKALIRRLDEIAGAA